MPTKKRRIILKEKKDFRYPGHDPKNIEMVLKLYSQGLGVSKIAEKTNLSHEIVTRILKHNEIPRTYFSEDQFLNKWRKNVKN